MSNVEVFKTVSGQLNWSLLLHLMYNLQPIRIEYSPAQTMTVEICFAASFATRGVDSPDSQNENPKGKNGAQEQLNGDSLSPGDIILNDCIT